MSEPCDAEILEDGPAWASSSLELSEMMRFDFLLGGTFGIGAGESSSLDIPIGVVLLVSGAKLIAARLSEDDSRKSPEEGRDTFLRRVGPFGRPGVK